MPSPVGHALGGMAAGWLVYALTPSRNDTELRWAGGLVGSRAGVPARPLGVSPTTVREGMLFAFLGMLPDIDFLFGMHSMHTHSLGAALVVALAAVALTSADRWRFALACFCAYASHILLDWLGDDTTPPIGIMALWPWSSDFYQSDLRWFMAITRRYWLSNFWTHNLQAVLRELIILVPAAVFAAWLRERGRAPARRRGHA